MRKSTDYEDIHEFYEDVKKNQYSNNQYSKVMKLEYYQGDKSESYEINSVEQLNQMQFPLGSTFCMFLYHSPSEYVGTYVNKALDGSAQGTTNTSTAAKILKRAYKDGVKYVSAHWFEHAAEMFKFMSEVAETSDLQEV